ncbi:MAG: 4-hydroxy-tetrahydrodipicolinate reductase [Thermomicrobiales bacterium]|nr:4-hydroxy-tetrahydrodipicolinate reductase [Thermomicrobiales bacterium]
MNSTIAIRIAIAGVGGRMGREIAAAAAGDPAFHIVGGIVRPGRGTEEAGWVSVAGTSAPHARLTADPASLIPDAEALIDFSLPEAVVAHARLCAEYEIPLVCGVTGLTPEQDAALRAAAARTPVYVARNMSVGVGALLAILPDLARLLPGYDIEIVETHHRRKQDAPSGTALALAEALAGPEPDLIFGRQGIAPRRAGEIGMHAVRGGGNPGEHTIVFSGEGDEVRVSHRAFGRRAYADGALRAAAWLIGQRPGLYGPADLRDPSPVLPRPALRAAEALAAADAAARTRSA